MRKRRKNNMVGLNDHTPQKKRRVHHNKEGKVGREGTLRRVKDRLGSDMIPKI